MKKFAEPYILLSFYLFPSHSFLMFSNSQLLGSDQHFMFHIHASVCLTSHMQLCRSIADVVERVPSAVLLQATSDPSGDPVDPSDLLRLGEDDRRDGRGFQILFILSMKSTLIYLNHKTIKNLNCNNSGYVS